MRAQAVPQTAQGADLRQHTQAAQAQPSWHLHEGRYGGANERAFKRRVNLARLLAKGLKTPGFCGTGKGLDGFVRAGRVGKQVQAAAVFPEVTCQHRQLGDLQFGFKRGAGRLENLVKHPAHGEDRGAAVDGRAVHHQLTHLAARAGTGLDHGHVQALCGQLQRTHQPGHAGAYHHDAVALLGGGFTHGAAWLCQCPCWLSTRMRTNRDSEKKL